jgi:C-type mannose receptor
MPSARHIALALALVGCADVSQLNDFEFVDPACEPEPTETTCFGVVCGDVLDNCGATVSCPSNCVGIEACEVGGVPANTCGCSSAATAPVAGAGCTGPWFGGETDHAHYVCPKDDFEPARAVCQSFGTDLNIVVSIEENTFIQNLIPLDGSNAHIGLWDRDCQQADGVPCNLLWVDGSDLSTFSNWAPLEPNNAQGAENCAEMRAGNGQWNDVGCGSRRHVICETTCP